MCAHLPLAPRAAAQNAGWNDEQALQLVSLARDYRANPHTRGSIRSYKAEAEGHVYFYLDREDGGDPIPMRVDQVAVDLFWRAPDDTRQQIRALRKKELLPVRDFQYYIDRLTAVQNGFGDLISIGQGRDVRSVPHPLSPAGLSTYHFRIVDEVTVHVPSMPRPVQVYEVEVEPKEDTLPGFVGSVFIEAATGALTRANFTFTPAAYVDPRVDDVTVSLEHSLWNDRHWLPFRQTVEVRRELPEIDFPLGSMIRATLEVGTYEFNPELADGFFDGPRITSVGYVAVDSTEFQSGLMEHMQAEGLSPISMADLESEARTHVKSRLVSGLPKVRFYADQVSSVLRANRAEGVHLGLGASASPHPELRLEGLLGYGLGNEQATASAGAQWQAREHSGTTWRVRGHWRELRDRGPRPAASRAVNTLSTLLWNQDFSDPYFSSGGRIEVRQSLGRGASLAFSASAETYHSALQVWSDAPLRSQTLRPVWPADEGRFLGTAIAYDHRWGGTDTWGAGARLDLSGGSWEGTAVGSTVITLTSRLSSSELTKQLDLSLSGGQAWGDLPNQMLFFLGGRGSLLGHPFRKFVGKRFALATVETSLAVVPGWLTARALGGAGFVKETPPEIEETWRVGPTSGVRGYVGLGVGTFHDLLRFDGAWGLRSGGFEFVVSVDPRIRPYL